MIGERVRHVRQYYGWSQLELANRSGSTQPQISKLERGSTASSEVVDAISDASGFARWWFDLGPLPDLPKGSLKFRKRASGSQRNEERVRAHIRQAIEVVERFSHVEGAPPVRIEPLLKSHDLHLDEIEQIAVEVREQLGLGSFDPIPNLTRASERGGVVIIGSLIPIDKPEGMEKHDGASNWIDYPLGRPVSCVSRGTPGDRQRLSIGHELGHLVLHQLRNIDPKRAEQEAFRFAGALLIPKEPALESIERPVTLRALAETKARWGISVRALIRRCLDLRLIDNDRRRSLEKQIFARGWGRSEPVDIPYEEPLLIRRLIETGTGESGLVGIASKIGLPTLAVRDLLA